MHVPSEEFSQLIHTKVCTECCTEVTSWKAPSRDLRRDSESDLLRCKFNCFAGMSEVGTRQLSTRPECALVNHLIYAPVLIYVQWIIGIINHSDNWSKQSVNQTREWNIFKISGIAQPKLELFVEWIVQRKFDSKVSKKSHILWCKFSLVRSKVRALTNNGSSALILSWENLIAVESWKFQFVAV